MIKTITSWQITWDGSGKEKPVFAQCGPVMETGSCIGWPSTSSMLGKIAVSSLCLYFMKFLYWSGLSSMLHKFIYNPIPDIQRTAESSCRNTRWVYCFGLVFDNLNNSWSSFLCTCHQYFEQTISRDQCSDGELLIILVLGVNMKPLPLSSVYIRIVISEPYQKMCSN